MSAMGKCRLTLAAVLCLIVSSGGGAPQATRSLAGRVSYDGDRSGRVIVCLYELRVDSRGRAVRLAKEDILGGAKPRQVLELAAPGSYAFDRLPPGQFSVLAFMDRDGNGKLGFDPARAPGLVRGVARRLLGPDRPQPGRRIRPRSAASRAHGISPRRQDRRARGPRPEERASGPAALGDGRGAGVSPTAISWPDRS